MAVNRHDCSDCYRLERQLPGGSVPPLEDRAFARRTKSMTWIQYLAGTSYPASKSRPPRCNGHRTRVNRGRYNAASIEFLSMGLYPRL